VDQSLKNVNVSTDLSSKEHNKCSKKNELKTFKKEVNKFLNDYTNLLQNSSQVWCLFLNFSYF